MLATDNSGATSWKIISEAFGAAQALPESSITMNLRFPGQYFDNETGAHYNFQRDYLPNLGRYMQSDPIGLSGGINIYGYAGGNPVAAFDILGLKVEVRCRPVGNPDAAGRGWRENTARVLGGEHCYIVVDCPAAGIDTVTISYLTAMSVVPRGGSPNNDTIYSERGEYRKLPVAPPANNDCKECKLHSPLLLRNECRACKFEECVIDHAKILLYIDYKIENYDPIRGPNSNSVAHRLVEMCGGVVIGTPPLTGWNDTGKVGF